MSESSGTPPPAAGPEVLIVDDDPRNVKLLESYLTGEGYRVRCASNGPEAVELARASVPDVVLLDVMMPGMSGHDVCRELRQDPRTRATPIVLVTALDSTAHRVEGLDVGADDYVTKPVRREEFLAKLRSLLRVRRLLLELQRARDILAQRNAQLEELESLRQTLAQTLVHDLKNPLAALMGNLDLMARQADATLEPLIERCRVTANRMHRMILDLLDVAGLEEGRLQLHTAPVSLAELARAAADEMGAAAAARRVRVAFEAAGSGLLVQGDASVLRRVVDNLLANAIEHSPPEREVRVRVADREEGVELAVADQGPGIPPEHRERVFEKYARLALRHSGVCANRGLGLTFCRLAVEAHGGTVWVEDAPGGGALFRVVLPALEPLDPPGSAAAEEGGESPG